MSAGSSPPDRHPGPAAWGASGALVGAASLAVDAAVGGAGPLGSIYASGLGVVVGGGLGLAWGAARRLLDRSPAAQGSLAWLALGAAAGLALAWRLGALARLSGPHAGLAWSALVGAPLAGIAVASCGLMTRRPGRAALWGACAVAAWTLDRAAPAAAYPPAHFALRCAGMWWAVLAVGPLRPMTRPWGRVVVASALALALGAFVGLGAPGDGSVGRLLSRPLPSFALSLLRGLTDVDGDGYSSLLGGGDCAPTDSAVHPGAAEIPGNGVDDNCLLGDAAGAAAGYAEAPPAAGPSPVSVALITVDTLRPDRMSAYGYGRETTPALAAWARGALRFDRAYTSGGWTTLALASLMRGVYPRRIRWTWHHETTAFRLLRAPFEGKLRGDEKLIGGFGLALDDPRPTLATRLRLRGMRTVAVVDDGYSRLLSPGFGPDQGFERYVNVSEQGRGGDAAVTAEAVAALRGLEGGGAFFLWAHYFGPHDPAERHEGVPDFGESASDRYDHEVAATDRHVGELLAALDDVGGRQALAVIVASDHGEAIQGEMRGHGLSLHESVVRIPMWVRGPGFEPGALSSPVSLVDLAPTVLQWTATPAPGGLDGVALQTLAAQGSWASARTLLTDVWRFDPFGRVVLNLTGAVDGRRKLIFDLLGQGTSLVRPAGADVKEMNLSPAETAPDMEAVVYRYLEAAGTSLDLVR